MLFFSSFPSHFLSSSLYTLSLTLFLRLRHLLLSLLLMPPFPISHSLHFLPCSLMFFLSFSSRFSRLFYILSLYIITALSSPSFYFYVFPSCSSSSYLTFWSSYLVACCSVFFFHFNSSFLCTSHLYIIIAAFSSYLPLPCYHPLPFCTLFSFTLKLLLPCFSLLLLFLPISFHLFNYYNVAIYLSSFFYFPSFLPLLFVLYHTQVPFTSFIYIFFTYVFLSYPISLSLSLVFSQFHPIFVGLSITLNFSLSSFLITFLLPVSPFPFLFSTHGTLLRLFLPIHLLPLFLSPVPSSTFLPLLSPSLPPSFHTLTTSYLLALSSTFTPSASPSSPSPLLSLPLPFISSHTFNPFYLHSFSTFFPSPPPSSPSPLFSLLPLLSSHALNPFATFFAYEKLN